MKKLKDHAHYVNTKKNGLNKYFCGIGKLVQAKQFLLAF